MAIDETFLGRWGWGQKKFTGIDFFSGSAAIAQLNN